MLRRQQCQRHMLPLNLHVLQLSRQSSLLCSGLYVLPEAGQGQRHVLQREILQRTVPVRLHQRHRVYV